MPDTKLTIQEAFDKVVLHLATQPERSTQGFRENPTCAYRGRDGLKCAIGAIIPDELYRPSLDQRGAPVTDFEVEKILDQIVEFNQTGKQRRDALELFSTLQQTHDDMTNWGDTGFKGFDCLGSIAHNYGLIAPEVTVTDEGVIVQVASVFADA